MLSSSTNRCLTMTSARGEDVRGQVRLRQSGVEEAVAVYNVCGHIHSYWILPIARLAQSGRASDS